MLSKMLRALHCSTSLKGKIWVHWTSPKYFSNLCFPFEYSETAAKIQCGEMITYHVVMSVFSPFPLTDE